MNRKDFLTPQKVKNTPYKNHTTSSINQEKSAVRIKSTVWKDGRKKVEYHYKDSKETDEEDKVYELEEEEEKKEEVEGWFNNNEIPNTL